MNLSELQPITKYGVTLRPLTHDKIEMVRQWRTDPKISQYMEYRGEITPEMQERWFLKINASGTDFYFIIETAGKEIGLINVKDVEWDKKTGETGIFIWDDDCLNSDYGVRSALAIHDFCFETLQLDYLHGHTLGDNKRANRLNKALGYTIAPNQEDVLNKEFYLYKDNYTKKTAPIRALLEKQYSKLKLSICKKS